MKKLLWTSAMALTAVACLTACDDSGSSSSSEIPTYKTEAALPDSCEMEVAKAGDTYFACFENEWVEVTDSATVEKIKEGLDEKELKEQLEELEEKLEEAAAATKKSSSSKKVASSADADEGDVTPESSASEECTGRRCGTGNSSSSKKSSGGSGNGGSGSGDSGSGSGSGSSSDSGVGSSDSEDGSSSSAKNSSSSVNNSSSSVNNSSSSKGNSSSSVAASSSSVDKCKGLSWNTTTQFCDSRDGQIYKKVTIGTKTWMAENLNYWTASYSHCYTDFTSDDCKKYGRLYDQYLIVNSSSSICPTGWHLPNNIEWQALIDAHETSDGMRSTEWESGTNSLGFNLLPAGFYQSGKDQSLNKASLVWSSNTTSTEAYYLLNTSLYGPYTNDVSAKISMSIRCVKD